MKATSIFGGVQVFNIIISIIRSKFIAVLLGPAGMGIAGLLNSTTGFISGLTNFGLGTSAVKDVAAANQTGDSERVVTVVTVLRRWVWITGTLGTLVTLMLSPWLSQLTFGNRDYTLAFAWISISMLFSQLSTGQIVVLQGLRRLQYLAKASVLGSLSGLIVTVPLYYKWGIKGIVPAIIINSIVTMGFLWYFAKKIKLESVKVSRATTIVEGRNMLTMGFMISLSGLIVLGASYIVRIFISNTGGIDQVGLYNAGFAIINSYVGLIFTSMATDYYPRLSSVAHDNSESKIVINQQAEITILILAPIVSVFLIFINWVVTLLYSAKFVGVSSMVHWAALGMFFKAASFPIGYILLAKGATKIFFWSELAANFYILGFNLFFYHFFGLEGLGISFLIGYALLLIQVFLIARINYDFAFKKEFYRIFGIQFLLALSCFLEVKLLEKPYPYLVGIILIIISTGFSLKELDKRLGLKLIVSNFRNKYLKR